MASCVIVFESNIEDLYREVVEYSIWDWQKYIEDNLKIWPVSCSDNP